MRGFWSDNWAYGAGGAINTNLVLILWWLPWSELLPHLSPLFRSLVMLCLLFRVVTSTRPLLGSSVWCLSQGPLQQLWYSFFCFIYLFLDGGALKTSKVERFVLGFLSVVIWGAPMWSKQGKEKSLRPPFFMHPDRYPWVSVGYYHWSWFIPAGANRDQWDCSPVFRI